MMRNEWLARHMLGLYKRWLSPFFGAQCKYVPNCSEYAASAIAHYGWLAGAARAFWRVLRCNPLSSGGYDPVK
jgi:uncharacterized protein